MSRLSVTFYDVRMTEEIECENKFTLIYPRRGGRYSLVGVCGVPEAG